MTVSRNMEEAVRCSFVEAAAAGAARGGGSRHVVAATAAAVARVAMCGGALEAPWGGVLGVPGVGERLAHVAPALAQLLLGQEVPLEDRVKRNVALHAAHLPAAEAPPVA